MRPRFDGRIFLIDTGMLSSYYPGAGRQPCDLARWVQLMKIAMSWSDSMAGIAQQRHLSIGAINFQNKAVAINFQIRLDELTCAKASVLSGCGHSNGHSATALNSWLGDGSERPRVYSVIVGSATGNRTRV